MIPEPSVLFSILTNIVVGIKKMIAANILHKTLDTDSIFLIEPVTLANAHSAKIIDYGDGELRKYKGYSDKNYDYISFFKNRIFEQFSNKKNKNIKPLNKTKELTRKITRYSSFELKEFSLMYLYLKELLRPKKTIGFQIIMWLW